MSLDRRSYEGRPAGNHRPYVSEQEREDVRQDCEQDAVRTGGCLCGAVRYSVRGEPLHVGRCHCADCRKESGSAFTVYGQWPREAFDLSGELATYDGRSFCPRCGSRLVCLNGAAVEVRIGSLDDALFGLQPEAEIWIKRREPWLGPVGGASQHEENRH